MIRSLTAIRKNKLGLRSLKNFNFPMILLRWYVNMKVETTEEASRLRSATDKPGSRSP